MFGLFIIKKGKEPVPLLSGYSYKQDLWDSGHNAAYAAKNCAAGHYYHINGYVPIKVQVRPIKDDAWHMRETERFTDGTYKALPWSLPARDATAFHFPHISTEDGAKIAYTQDSDKGMRDIQTRIKPGRYLAQFYGDVYDTPTIARMAAEFDRDYGDGVKLQFANTEDEIENVYVHGPHSCMAYRPEHFNSSIHPCRIYAAGDLAVAYIERNGSITARCLVWPEKKLAGRLYGDEVRLHDLLEEAGYTGFHGDNLEGARMLRIKEGRGFVMPYIDGSQSAGDDGEYLILGGHGIYAGNQYGTSVTTICCTSCDESVDEDDASTDNDGNSFCSHCYNERYSYCERYNEECLNRDMQEVIVALHPRRRQWWGESACEAEAFVCEGNGNWYDHAFAVSLHDGTVWSHDHFEDHGFICEGTNEAYSMDDCVTLSDGRSWSKDYFAENGIEVDGKFYAKGDEPSQDETTELEQAA